MKALSIKQPWAWAVCNLPEPFRKNIENRTWNTKYRGEFLVHASKGFDDIGYNRMCRYLSKLGYTGVIPTKKEFVFGAIIGKTELIDALPASSNIWFEGVWGFELANTVAFDNPIPYKGQLSFFNVEEEIIQAESKLEETHS